MKYEAIVNVTITTAMRIDVTAKDEAAAEGKVQKLLDDGKGYWDLELSKEAQQAGFDVAEVYTDHEFDIEIVEA
jgi:hypothetical protein